LPFGDPRLPAAVIIWFMPDLVGYVAGPGEGIGGDGPDVKATAATTAGALTVMESVIRQGPPRHVHTHEDECFYVLDGTVAVTCGDEAFEAGPRGFVFLPRGLAHTFRAAQGEARVLMIAVPGGIEHYFGEINNAASTAEQERIGATYGIRIVLAVPAAPVRGAPQGLQVFADLSCYTAQTSDLIVQILTVNFPHLPETDLRCPSATGKDVRGR
jgi:mannose-6-phosphate isomerase-like protein (cupin superfamily)